MTAAIYPALYQVNTRVWLHTLSHSLGRTATLDDISDTVLDEWVEQGFDWIWLLSVWQTGPLARAISRSNRAWIDDIIKSFPEMKEDDVIGSGFAIASYSVSTELGGDGALARLRSRMKQRGLKLMLDFVPNHLGPDHPWIKEHPDYFIRGSYEDLTKEPSNYFELDTGEKREVFAHGRDPNYSGWADTVQVNYQSDELQQAMRMELLRIAGQCDGLRCDMAMLVLPDVFKRTWGLDIHPFWESIIPLVRDRFPGFTFLAEVYWGLEWELQQRGFDYCYDKRLFDRLNGWVANPIRQHLLAELAYQKRLARFLENHDEMRAAARFDYQKHKAAAVITYLTPGLRFFHQGQLDGYRVHISPHLNRGPNEQVDSQVASLYEKIMSILKLRQFRCGNWRLLEPYPAWKGNFAHEDFIMYQWTLEDANTMIVIINFSDHESQCRVLIPQSENTFGDVHFYDHMSETDYVRHERELNSEGLFVSLPAWGSHVFELKQSSS